MTNPPLPTIENRADAATLSSEEFQRIKAGCERAFQKHPGNPIMLDMLKLIAQNAALRAEGESEREARWKSEAALRMKDEAVNTLMMRLREKHGDNCEDLIP